MTKEGVYSTTSYILGILSIVLAFFQPIQGLVIGIVGLIQSKKEKTDLSKNAKKLNTWGIILSIIMLAIVISLTFYAYQQGLGNVQLPGL